MGFGSKPKRPEYEQQADTPWITRNRDMNTWSYKNVADNINRVNVFDDATRQSLNDYVDDIYNRSKSDFDRTYSQTMNKYLARDYNRLGTTGASTSLLNRDNYNLQQQRALADLAYNRATTYEDMINQELSRRYKFLDTNYNYFTDSGKTIQDFDNANWQIRNANKDIQYLNDIQGYNSKMNTWNAIGKTLSTVGGAVANAFLPGSGFVVTGLGNSLTDAFASPINASGSSLYGIYNNKGTGYVGNSYGNSQNLLPYLLSGDSSNTTDWLSNIINKTKSNNINATPIYRYQGYTPLSSTAQNTTATPSYFSITQQAPNLYGLNTTSSIDWNNIDFSNLAGSLGW